MNKKYEQTKEERHEKRRVDQKDFQDKHAQQAGEESEATPKRDGGFRKGEQQAETPKHRQQGGWNPDEDRSGRKPAEDRDRDYDPDGDRT